MENLPNNSYRDYDRKHVSISGKRQITIPQKFFTKLGFTDEAEFIMRGDELILRPYNKGVSGEFSEEILADLIKQGYSGEELLEKFKIEQRKMKSATRQMLADAHNAAVGKGEYSTYEDIFGEDE